MKIRSSFVSNSSSSSYVCVICGAGESGMDISCGDVGMVMSKGGVYYCLGHIDKQKVADFISNIHKNYTAPDYKSTDPRECWYYEFLMHNNMTHEEFVELSKQSSKEEMYEEFVDNLMFASEGYGLPSEICALEDFSYITDTDIARYLLHKHSITREDLLNELKRDYVTLSNMEKCIERPGPQNENKN